MGHSNYREKAGVVLFGEMGMFENWVIIPKFISILPYSL